jgi:tetratricopeptide (TPR) repeat protein
MEKMSFGRLFALLAMACVSSEGWAPAARAQEAGSETNQARDLFRSGVERYEAGQYALALGDFEHAYALKPHPLVQVNIANCYDKLDQPAEALTHFEAFLASTEGSADQRDEVRSAMARLSKSAGRLSIRATPAGAQGVIDQKRTAQPLQWVSPGRHRVDITAEGYEPAIRVVDVQPGETVEVNVELAQAQDPAPNPPVAGANVAPTVAPSAAPSAAAQEPAIDEALVPIAIQTAPSKGHPAAGLPASVWISGGATFGLGVIAVVTGQLALAANREYDTNLTALRNSALTEYQRAGAWARGIDAADRADALAAVTDILLTFTFVGVGLTTYFYLADRDASERQRLRVGLRSDARSGRLELRGTF